VSHEITNMDLLGALHRRADRESRLLRVACRRNDKINERFDELAQTGYCPRTGELVTHDGQGNVLSYIKDLNRQRGMGNMVSPDGQPDGIGESVQPEGDDVRHVEHKVRATDACNELMQRSYDHCILHGPGSGEVDKKYDRPDPGGVQKTRKPRKR